MSLNTAATRPASPSELRRVVPSAIFPLSTRATDILPPCEVLMVLSTYATGWPPFTPSRFAVSATPGDSWRNAFIRRSTPLVRVAEPNSTGQTKPSRNSLERSSKTLSRRSEEHTSELQSRENLVCRLLLEKKKQTKSHDARLKQTNYQNEIG